MDNQIYSAEEGGVWCFLTPKHVRCAIREGKRFGFEHRWVGDKPVWNYAVYEAFALDGGHIRVHLSEPVGRLKVISLDITPDLWAQRVICSPDERPPKVGVKITRAKEG